MDIFNWGASEDRRGLLPIAALFVILLSVLLLYSIHGLRQTASEQQQLNRQTVQQAAAGLHQKLNELRDKLQLFLQSQREPLTQIVAPQREPSLVMEFNNALHANFPFVNNFALAGEDGTLILEDSIEHLDRACREDIQQFLTTGTPSLISIHDARPGLHFSLLAKTNLGERRYVLLVTFKPQLIDTVLGAYSSLRYNLINHAKSDALEWGVALQNPKAATIYRQTIAQTAWTLAAQPVEVESVAAGWMRYQSWITLILLSALGVLTGRELLTTRANLKRQELRLSQQTEVLNTSQRRTSHLQDIIAEPGISLTGKIQKALVLGVQEFELQNAIVSKVENGDYVLLHVYSSDNSLLQGSRFPLVDTYCRDTLEAGYAQGFHNAQETEWCKHACYRLLKTQAYIGTALVVAGQPFGTLSFSSQLPRAKPFDESDFAFINSMAQWVGVELERTQHMDQMQQTGRMFQSLRRTQGLFIRDTNPRRMFAVILSEIMTLTGSDIGFIAEVQNVNEALLANETHVCKVTGSHSEKVADPSVLFTMWQQILRPVVAGEQVFEFTPVKSGESPVGLRNYCGLPIYYGQCVVGVLALADRDGGFDPSVVALLQLLMNESGNLIWVCRNERKRAHIEMVLREKEQRFDAIVAETRDGLWEWQVQSQQAWFSPRFKALLNYHVDDFAPLFKTFLSHVHPQDLNVFTDALNRHLRNRDGFDLECRLRTKQSDYRWVRVNGQAQWNAQGQAVRMAGSIMDVAERKRIDAMKNEFFSTVTHEFQQPLQEVRSALAFVSGQATRRMTDQGRQMIQTAESGVQRLLACIDSRLESEGLRNTKELTAHQNLKLTTVLELTVTEFLREAGQKNVRIVLRPLQENYPLEIAHVRITQVLNNLLSNALTFSPEGSEVTVSAVGQGKWVRIWVNDRGPGIPDSFRSRMFARKNQGVDVQGCTNVAQPMEGRERQVQDVLMSAQQKAKHGSDEAETTGDIGLGLSLAQSIVLKHGGRIDYLSHAGFGTTFFVDLPLQPQDAQQTNKKAHSDKPPCVLLCESDAHANVVLQHALVQGGMDFEIAGQERGALKSITERGYDAVMMAADWLSRADTVSNLARLNQLNVPVLLCSTAIPADGAPVKVAGISMLQWLFKPLDRTQFSEAVVMRIHDEPVTLFSQDAGTVAAVCDMLTGDNLNVVTDTQGLLDQAQSTVLILDLSLPEASIRNALQQIIARSSLPAVMFLAADESHANHALLIKQCLSAADGDVGQLIAALRGAIQSKIPVPPVPSLRPRVTVDNFEDAT